jgi:hypothetical protein
MTLEKVVTIALVITGLIVAAFIVGGRFTVAPGSQHSTVYVVDRFTGSVRFCTPSECTYVSDKKLPDDWVVPPKEPASRGYDDLPPATSARAI